MLYHIIYKNNKLLKKKVNVVDDDIFSSKAICVYLITVCISSCSNCDLLHINESYPINILYVYMIINCKGPLLEQKY